MNYLDASIQFDRHLLTIPLVESGEVCVPLQSLCRKYRIPMLFSGGKKKVFWLRTSVAEAFMNAATLLLTEGFVLVVKDTYRSLAIQKKMFLAERLKVKQLHSRMSDGNVNQLANTFVAGIPVLAAHTAGAAVDVTLRAIDKHPVDLGCPYLTFSKQAITDSSSIGIEAKKNRNILVSAMKTAGFTNYPFEYWHFSLGDVCDAYVKKKQYAVYGPVEIDMQTGRIVGVLPTMENRTYFKNSISLL